jgi:hypothetical protein
MAVVSPLDDPGLATRFGRGSGPERDATMKAHPFGGSIEHVRRAA